MSHHIYTIPKGDAGTLQTLRLMGELSVLGAMVPAVRDTAATVVRGHTRGIDRAEALSAWIGAVTEFLPDPVHVEALVPATVSLDKICTQGYFQGDCDDVAVLAAAMGMSIGLRAKFVVVAFGRPGERKGFEHVWTELSPLEIEEWIVIDPPRPENMVSIARGLEYHLIR